MSDRNICPFCGAAVPSDQEGCPSCGKSWEEIRREQEALNRDANLRMGIDPALADEPWGAR